MLSNPLVAFLHVAYSLLEGKVSSEGLARVDGTIGSWNSLFGLITCSNKNPTICSWRACILAGCNTLVRSLKRYVWRISPWTRVEIEKKASNVISYLKVIEPNSISVRAKYEHESKNIKHTEIVAGWLPHTLQEERIRQWNELNLLFCRKCKAWIWIVYRKVGFYVVLFPEWKVDNTLFVVSCVRPIREYEYQLNLEAIVEKIKWSS